MLVKFVEILYHHIGVVGLKTEAKEPVDWLGALVCTASLISVLFVILMDGLILNLKNGQLLK